jgi:undecaprenyl-diphosphatase
MVPAVTPEPQLVSDAAVPVAADTGIEIIEQAGPETMRSPVDLVRFILSAAALVVLLLLEWLFGRTLVTFAYDLFRGLSAVPHWLLSTLVVGLRLLGIVLLGGGLLVALVRGRWRMLVTVGVAAVLAVGLGALVRAVAPSAAGEVVHVSDVLGPVGGNGFPSAVVLTLVCAIVSAATPWVRRGWRRAGWALIIGLAVTRFVAAPISFDALGAVLVGWLAGATAVLLLGAPSRRPVGTAIADGLAVVNLPVVRLQQASLDARGSTPYFGTARDGRKLFVKALGQDERSADLLFRLYRRVLPHDLGDEKPFESLRRTVEHEGLVALVAHGLGVRTPMLLGLATAEPNGFVLAYEAIDGRSLDRLAPEEVTDDVLTGVWEQVALLRLHRVAHRDLRLANVFLGADGDPWMIDFGFSELAVPDLLLANDVAELVASSSLLVGIDRAVDRAGAVIGVEQLGTALPRLRSWALSGATRRALKAHPGLLEQLRVRIAAMQPSPPSAST